MSEENNTGDKNNMDDNIAKGIISYKKFLDEFKRVNEDEVFMKDPNDPNTSKYIFRTFNTECYIIDKKYFDKFRSATNFDKLNKILEPANEENEKKFKEELSKYLQEHPYEFSAENIKLYSELEELKKVVKNFNNYSFVNKGILCDAMGISESDLENKAMKVSKNQSDTCILSHNFTMIIPKKKVVEKKQEIPKYKNLYYVEDITKKIFILLNIFNDEIIQKKLKKEIKYEYNFKGYYLINKEWLDNYKEFFFVWFYYRQI